MDSTQLKIKLKNELVTMLYSAKDDKEFIRKLFIAANSDDFSRMNKNGYEEYLNLVLSSSDLIKNTIGLDLTI